MFHGEKITIPRRVGPGLHVAQHFYIWHDLPSQGAAQWGCRSETLELRIPPCCQRPQVSERGLNHQPAQMVLRIRQPLKGARCRAALSGYRCYEPNGHSVPP